MSGKLAGRHSLSDNHDTSPRSRKRRNSRDESEDRDDEHNSHSKHHKRERQHSKNDTSPPREAPPIVPISLPEKEKQLMELVSSRLEESSWYTTIKETIKTKLLTYQSSQLLRTEKVIEALVGEIRSGVRQTVPDKVKKELVDAVREYLDTQPDKVLLQFDDPKRRTASFTK